MLIFSNVSWYLFLLMIKNVRIMSHKNRSRSSCFGAPADFSESQLPTYLSVGQQFVKSKIDLQNERPGEKITNLEVWRNVSNFMLMN